MSEGAPGRVRGVLLAHGDMARGLVDAVRKISGQGEEALLPLSNEGRTPEGLRRELERVLDESPAIVFTDLHGGSCALAAVAASRRHPTAVVCGANLPMLLEFVFHRDESVEALSQRLVRKGQEGIRSLGCWGDRSPPPPGAGGGSGG